MTQRSPKPNPHVGGWVLGGEITRQLLRRRIRCHRGQYREKGLAGLANAGRSDIVNRLLAGSWEYSEMYKYRYSLFQNREAQSEMPQEAAVQASCTNRSTTLMSLSQNEAWILST